MDFCINFALAFVVNEDKSAMQRYKKMVKTLLLSVLIIAIAMALLCVKLLFRKDGEFTSMHIHDSQAMKDQGIHCVMDQDREARKQGKAY